MHKQFRSMKRMLTMKEKGSHEGVVNAEPRTGLKDGRENAGLGL